MSLSVSAFSNSEFDVWLDFEGNFDWIEFGQEYSCSLACICELVNFLKERGYVEMQGDSLRPVTSVAGI